MKKLFTLAVISGLFLNSCGKEEAEIEYTPMINGTWKLSKVAQISGKDGHIINSITMEGCDLENTYTFNANNSFKFEYHEGSNCETITSEEGTYDYINSPSINKLVLKYANDPEVEELIVQKLDELELQTYSPELEDFNGDGVLDKTVMYMHR